jgi:hypothetical protein
VNFWKLSSENVGIPDKNNWSIPESVDERDLGKPFYEYRTIYSDVPWSEWNLPKPGVPNWEADIRIQWRLERGGFAEFYWQVGRMDIIEVRSGDGRKISADEARGLNQFINRPFIIRNSRPFHYQVQKPMYHNEEQRRAHYHEDKMNALVYFQPTELVEAVAKGLEIGALPERPLEEDEEFRGEIETEFPDEVYSITSKITGVLGLVMHEGRYGWWNDHRDLTQTVASAINRNPSLIGIFIKLYEKGDGRKAAELLKNIEPKTPLVLLTEDEQDEGADSALKHASIMRIWSLGDA